MRVRINWCEPFLCLRGSFLGNVINADQHQIPYFTEHLHCQTCHGWCGKIPRPSPFVFAYFKWLMTGVWKNLGVRLGVVYWLFYVLTHPLFPLHFSILLFLILMAFLNAFIGLLYSQESYCNPTSIIVPILKHSWTRLCILQYRLTWGWFITT